MKIITGILVTIPAVLLAWYLNLDTVDIRYILSEEIPAGFVEEITDQSIQQIVVKNNGNLLAENVRLKINKQIGQTRLIKFSEIDSPEEFNLKNGFELVYPKLPPQASFKLVFKSNIAGIKPGEVEVTHSKGTGKEALDKPVEYYSQLIYLGLIGFYLILIMGELRGNLKNDFEWKYMFSPEDILKRKKPFLMKNNDWSKIRLNAVEKYVNNLKSRFQYGADSLTTWPLYKMLNKDKLNHFSIEEWDKFIELGNRAFCDDWSDLVNNLGLFYNAGELKKLFAVPKPLNFDDGQWNEIIKKLEERFFASKKILIMNRFNKSVLIEESKSSKPEGLSEEVWEEYQNFLKDQYYQVLLQDCYQELDPISYISGQYPSLLDPQRFKKIKNVAYQIQLKNLPAIRSGSEARKFLQQSQPEWIHQEDWEALKASAKTIVEREETELRLNSLETSLEETRQKQILEKEELNTLIPKVRRQLDTINEFIRDPTVLDRLEEYENVFAPGNFENLKTIAQMAKKVEGSA